MPTRNFSEQVFVDTYLAKLTLEQKIGQMTMGERMFASPQDAKKFHLGSVLSGGGSHPGENAPADWVQMNDEYWAAMMEGDDALGLPILFGIDAVHGHNNVRGATIFPHNIGFGAADSTELVEAAARITAQEILATGVDWNFAPTLAVVQNPQWGRTYESYGDDPTRAARYGKAYVEGLQSEQVMGCAKHWVGDGGTLHGIDQGETAIEWDELESKHILPYYPALDAGVMSVMVSFNSWQGVKCHGHEFLVTTLLKERLGFDGVVVSDWDGIDYLDENFEVAVASAVNAGLDMFMVPEKWRDFIASLLRQVGEGTVSMARIDDAVTRILLAKRRLGLIDAPRPNLRFASNAESFGSPAHREVARDVVRRSQVLLKNEDCILPLSVDQKILVAGRNAHNLGSQCGGWTVSWQGEEGNDAVVGTSIWQGIQKLAPNAELSADLSGSEADANRHSVAVVVIGERPYAEGFGDVRPGDDLLIQAGSMIDGLMNPLEPYGRTLELANLHPEDLATIRRIEAAGVPVVTLLVSGRPLIVEQEFASSQAFIASWLPGSEGAGVAEMLFGFAQFSGRLPMPWPSRKCSETQDSSYEVRFESGYGLTIDVEHSIDIDNVVKAVI